MTNTAPSRILPPDNRIQDRPAYYPLLDYLRGLASLGVLVSHSDIWHILPEEAGNASVQIFFALSGFLIGSILLKSNSKDLPQFYFNRATRIWIPYYLAIALVVVVTAVKQPISDPKIWEIIFYKITFVYNWFGVPQLAPYVNRFPLAGTANHFWSICVEEQFYLIAPFIIAFTRKITVAILTFCILLNFIFPHNFASISLGVLLAISHQKLGEWYTSTTIRFALALSICGLLTSITIFPKFYPVIFPFVAVSVVALLAQSGQQHFFGRIVAGISFSLYLDSWISFFAVGFTIKALHLQIGDFQAIAMATILALVVSYLHYTLIDRTIARSRGKWYSRKIGFSICVSGFALVFLGLSTGLLLRR